MVMPIIFQLIGIITLLSFLNPVLQLETYMWNLELFIVILQTILVMFGMVDFIWCMVKYNLRGIFNTVHSMYGLTKFKVMYVFCYVGCFVGFFAVLRYFGMGRKLDLKNVYNSIYEKIYSFYVFSGDKFFFCVYVLIILVGIWIIGVRLFVLMKIVHEYGKLGCESIHYWLWQYNWYSLRTSGLRSKLTNIHFDIGSFIFKRLRKYRSTPRRNKFILWFYKKGIWQIFKIIPFFVFIGTFTWDCLYNNFVIYNWYNIVVYISLYMLIIKLIEFYGNLNDKWLEIADELYNIYPKPERLDYYF